MSRNSGHRIVTVEYSCGYVTTFYDKPPRIGELVFCRHCDRPVRVTRDDLDQWTAKCLNCAYSTAHGKYGRLSAERAATRHRHSKKGLDHTVEVRDADGGLDHVFKSQEQIPFGDVTDT